jgi:rRNA maturation endonuclease Nob1
MISFKSFINAIHDAILKANETLMDKNEALLDKYFEETDQSESDKDKDEKKTKSKVLTPKSVILDYPYLDENNVLDHHEIHVPLITIVPLATSQIESATLTADFEMQFVDEELKINFVNKSNTGLFQKTSKASRGTLEITIKPQETSEGLRMLIEGYETMIKRQLP